MMVMSTSKTNKVEVTEEMERAERAATVRTQLEWMGQDKFHKLIAYFNISNLSKKTKYITRIKQKAAIDDSCSCADQLNRNTQQFQDDHGYALQCKHICASRDFAQKFNLWGDC